MSDYIIYYQYTEDPNAKICNVSIRAESYEKAVELFYARYPKSNYRIVDPE